MNIEENVSLAFYTSWLVGGEAEFYAAPSTVEELKTCIFWAQDNGKEITILGGGTNVLVSDDGVPGLVVHVKGVKELDVYESKNDDRLVIEAECGVSKSKLLKTFLKYKLPPALFLAGLPGDVGGGIAMNAGIGESLVPREFVEITDWIEVLFFSDLKIRRYEKEDLQWSYRSCKGWERGVITRAGFSWQNKPDENILSEVKKLNKERLSKQPLELPSCGSVFRNPEGDSAGRLIEACGLKGFSIGGAQVSEKHANFIVNKGNATAAEITRVIEEIQQRVLEKFSVELQIEVVRLG